MKLWLDDNRPAPSGWHPVKTVHEAIRFLRTGKVTKISLDHDLGEKDGQVPSEILPIGAPPSRRELNGMVVLEWMAATNIWPRDISIHTSNPKAREDMQAFLSANYPRLLV